MGILTYMPYTIETKTPEDTRFGMGRPSVAWSSIARRAVATLDEARERARDAVNAVDVGLFLACEQAEDIPESGGTVGLPDGTVIEVAPVTVSELATAAGWPAPPLDEFTPDLIDAYNAAQV